MSDTQTVQPALSEAEWARRRYEPQSCPDLIIHDDGDGLEFVVVEGDRAERRVVSKHKLEEWYSADIHACMALANAALPDGHPGKVTRAMVDAAEHGAALLTELAMTRSAYNTPEIAAILHGLNATAAKLQALLPGEG